MAGATGNLRARTSAKRGASEPTLVKWLLIGLALGYLGLFLILPLAAVFSQALEKGLGTYFKAITDPDALSAIKLTLLTAAIAVPVNLLFGLTASWAIAKFDFWGKNLLTTLVDLPFAAYIQPRAPVGPSVQSWVSGLLPPWVTSGTG
ncbi:MAG: sulfate/thiosulfate ABC transporter permease CysW, partial [Armatimonadota bacterium]